MNFGSDVRNRIGQSGKYQYKLSSELFLLDSPILDSQEKTHGFPFGFYPTFYSYRLDEPQNLKGGANILTCGMGDLFQEKVPNEWIELILQACQAAPQHNYLFLTSNFSRINKFSFSENMWVGYKINQQNSYSLTSVDFSHTSTYLYFDLSYIPSFETIELILSKISWIVLGYSGSIHNPKIESNSLVGGLLKMCRINHIPVYMESSVSSLLSTNIIQQIPNMLLKHNPPIKENKLYAPCSFCKKVLKKREMVSLLSRQQRGASSYKLGYACKDCFDKLKKALSSDDVITL